MNLSRRNFLGGMAAGTALAVAPGCVTKCCQACRPGKIALQLYSIGKWIGQQDKDQKVALAKALQRIAEIGYEGVEFAGYWGCNPQELSIALSNAGLKACGTHVGNDQYGFDTKKWTYNPEILKRTADFNLGYGNDLVICPGGGNFPPGVSWGSGRGGDQTPPSKEIDEFTKRLVEFYNKAAADAKKLGIRIGLHNHSWEHATFMMDGTSFWDYFFTNTDKSVCMEQDVGWTTCASDFIPGVNPMVQFQKYPHRSPTLHAKENGMGKGVVQFDAILGQPGRDADGNDCATPVNWDALFPVTDLDGVEWYVVECERHFDDIEGAVVPSFEFLESKGRI